MNSFRFHAYTDMRFGEGKIAELPQVLKPFGSTVLLTYGGGSIKKTGLYDRILDLLADFTVIELGGIEPNPRIESVREGARLCKEHKVDVVLAVGGGSTIDASKVMAAGANYDGDSWDLVTNPEKIASVLPIVTVLTLCATGSEMNKNAVISNMSLNEKLGTAAHDMIPQASICDPAYLYTLPPKQTAAGTADIMSHIFEQYFQKDTGAYLSDCISESILKTCIKYCPIALKDPENYEARANLMWASSLALNGLPSAGKGGAWTCHPIEHELSAFYDITHGVGLAIVTPRWMRYILNDETVDKFCDYAKNVWNIQDITDKYAAANQAIDKTEEFFKNCGIPMTLAALNINEEHFDSMSEKAARIGGLQDAYVPLNAEDVKKILQMC